MIDLSPAAGRLAELLDGVDDSQLGSPTPCPEMTVGDLVDHIGTFAVAFVEAAAKQRDASAGPPPQASASNLEPGWRDRIARDIDALVAAWREPSAWEGMTAAGGLELPAEVTGVIALDELIVHGWDLAVSTGQPFTAADDDVAAATGLVSNLPAPRDGRLFGPIVSVGQDASPLDRLLGVAGRDPSWRP